jgi:hypothetical protein
MISYPVTMSLKCFNKNTLKNHHVSQQLLRILIESVELKPYRRVPDLNGLILRGSIDQTLTTPFHTSDGCSVLRDTHDHTSHRCIPNTNGVILGWTCQSIGLWVTIGVRMKWTLVTLGDIIDLYLCHRIITYRWYGSHERHVIHFVWPFNPSPNAFPVFGSQRRTVLSILPDANVLPSGAQAM